MDKVRCPYCGGIMALCLDSYSDGTVAGAYCECIDCKAGSPYIEDADDIKAAAYAAAMQRWMDTEPRPPDNYIGEQAVEYGAPFDEPM